MSGFSSQQLHTLRSVGLVTGCLSMIGCLFIGFSLHCLPKRQDAFQHKLLQWITFSGFFAAFFFSFETLFMHSLGDDISDIPYAACMIQAVGIQFFNTSLCLWVSIIAYSSYLLLIRRVNDLTPYHPYFCGIAWGIPTLTCVALGASGDFGETKIWCWIKSDVNILRIMCFHIIIILACIFDISIYIIVNRKLQAMIGSDDDCSSQSPSTTTILAPVNKLAPYISKLSIRVSRRMQMIVVAFFVCWIWGIINRFQNLINPDHPVLLALWRLRAGRIVNLIRLTNVLKLAVN